MTQPVLAIIDAQRGFMPASEGERLGVAGFGELGIAQGADVVAPINRLAAMWAQRGWPICTTQDWHPVETAHFSGEPDFMVTWPVHCVAGTPGAELHPELQLPAAVERFRKGNDVLVNGADDTSYSGWYAQNDTETLPEFVRRQAPSTIYVVGLAFDYCVGQTARDLAQRGGWQVVVLHDATRAVAPASEAEMMMQLQATGVRIGHVADVWDMA